MKKNKANEVVNKVDEKKMDAFVASFVGGYHKLISLKEQIAQSLCDAWHESGILNHESLSLFGEKVGREIMRQKITLSFPELASICMTAELGKSEARTFLNGVSEGSDRGTPQAISQALSKAEYVMGAQTGRPPVDPVEALVQKMEKALAALTPAQLKKAKPALRVLLD